MKGSLRIAILGTKFMGRVHSNAWRQVVPFFEPSIEPVRQVACGRDPEATRNFADRWGWVEAETDWRRVVERKDVDVIDLCMPQHLMAEVAIAAVENGKHVLCEKPMAMSWEEGQGMAEAALRAGVVHQVNYNYRARKHIDSNNLGPSYIVALCVDIKFWAPHAIDAMLSP